LRIAIVGYRDFHDYNFVEKKFLEVVKNSNLALEDVHIVSGGARGVDEIAQEIARRHGLSITIHYPNWKKYGKRAAAIRNRKIVDDCDIIIAFPSENSRGTAMTVNMARSAGKKIYAYKIPPKT